MARYLKKKAKITSAELRKLFAGKYGRPLQGHEDDFPTWIWPYIRRAYIAGKLTEMFTVPEGAEMKDYPLVVIGFLQEAGIEFPGTRSTKPPKGFFSMVKEATSAKHMDQYGKVVSPEDLDNIPRPLWPYITPSFNLGRLLELKEFKDVGQRLK